MAGLDLPVRAIRQQIAASIHLIVQQSRFSDGSAARHQRHGGRLA